MDLEVQDYCFKSGVVSCRVTVSPNVKDVKGHDDVYTWSVGSDLIYFVYHYFYSCKLLLLTQFARTKFMSIL